MYATTRTTLKALGMLLGVLLLGSCGINEPDNSVWENVGDFSWPTSTGTGMKYRTVSETADPTESTAEIELADGPDPSRNYYNGTLMYQIQITAVKNLNYADSSMPVPVSSLRFLRMHDTLVVKSDMIGDGYALVAPLEKGHRWVASYTNSGDTAWMGEIIELLSAAKVEGKAYENVVAVKYRRPKKLSSIYKDEEWIRYYAQGIGEIMTIRNVYPDESTLSDPLPRQDQRTVLIETKPAQ